MILGNLDNYSRTVKFQLGKVGILNNIGGSWSQGHAGHDN